MPTRQDFRQTRGIDGLPEQLLEYLRETHEELILAYETIIGMGGWLIIDTPSSVMPAYVKKYNGWHDVSNSKEAKVACERLVEMGEWGVSRECPNLYIKKGK